MGDRNQLISHAKPLNDGERRAATGLTCSSDHAITRSSDDPSCPPGQPITRLADSTRCGDCLAAMAHRLSQPVTALRGGIELGLIGKRSVADYRSLLEQSLQLADNLAQLIVSLRDLGESGTPVGPPQCVFLEAVATEALAEIEGLAQSRDLCLQLKVEGTPKVNADPERLREALLSLLAWVIQNNTAGGVMILELSAADGEARVVLSPSRLDLQYLQIKVLEDITNPGLLFSHAAKNGALGWLINQRLFGGLGAKLEILIGDSATGSIRVHLPLASAS